MSFYGVACNTWIEFSITIDSLHIVIRKNDGIYLLNIFLNPIRWRLPSFFRSFHITFFILDSLTQISTGSNIRFLSWMATCSHNMYPADDMKCPLKIWSLSLNGRPCRSTKMSFNLNRKCLLPIRFTKCIQMAAVAADDRRVLAPMIR